MHRVARSRRAACVVRCGVVWCAHGMETAAEVPAEAALCAVVARAWATLGARGVASAAGVSRACRAAAGPHGVVRAALGSQDAGERVKGCKVVAARVRAGEGENEQEAASAADEKRAYEAADAAGKEARRSTFDALLEALLRDGKARVRREAVRALWVLSGGDVAPERAKAMAAALDGEVLFTLEGHGRGVECVCFSPDGKMMASGSGDEMDDSGDEMDDSYNGTVRLWDAATGACVRTLEGHDWGMNSVCFSPDGNQQVASGSNDSTVRLCDVVTWRQGRAYERSRGTEER